LTFFPASNPFGPPTLSTDLSACGRAARIDALDAQSAALLSDASRLALSWEQADGEFRMATERYERAASHWNTAAADARATSEAYRQVAASYRAISTALVVIAALGVAQGVCEDLTSTRTLRARLRAEGVDLRGVDVDHLWPRSLGGADHPANYQLLSAPLNRSLGASVAEKFLTMPLATLRGLAVSAIAAVACSTSRVVAGLRPGCCRAAVGRCHLSPSQRRV
jgi:hypothetical protein